MEKRIIKQEESNCEAVSDTCFGDSEEVPVKEKENIQSVNDKEVSKDPFGIYEILNRSKVGVNPESSIPYPPGFTPKEGNETTMFVNISQEVQEEHHKSASCSSRVFEEVKNSDIYVQSEGKEGRPIRKEGGSILDALDDMIKKHHHIISDNFVALYGMWIPKKIQILIISIYAPQPFAAKRQLWDYITSLISQWRGDCIVLGDFNEVRCKEERWGSTFHAQGARLFNSFISNTGLNEVQLEGFSFTWAHPSASKMSKLDRFLVSDGIFTSFPHISAVCLDRHLSDHRPIILREKLTDFGATPFRFYHSWLSIPGFDQLVNSSWNSFNFDDSNGMIRFKKKLQCLKKEIRKWVADFKSVQSSCIKDIKKKLCDIDKVLDQGGVTDDVLLSRMETMKQLHDLNSSNNIDFVQKAKVRWAIEGDENTKFFHGVINRKRANLFVKGIMIDGVWVDDPSCVKEEFRYHFEERFNDPGTRRGSINFRFPNRLSIDQIPDLESAVSDEEIRKAVWGCGETKCPAYDSVRWDYLDDVLNAFGFGTLWRSWIQGSLNSGKASILFQYQFETNGILRSNFFNGIQEGDRKIVWVKWIKVLAAKKFGGLGVSSFFALNRGLIAKWVWRFISGDNSLWCKFISATHGSSHSTSNVTYPSIWKSILKEFYSLKVQGIDIFSHCKIKIGNGLCTRFWKDRWLDNTSLAESFPRLFALETDIDISVAAKLRSIVASFRRSVRGGVEDHQLQQLVSMLDYDIKDVLLALDRLPTRANLALRGVVSDPLSCPIYFRIPAVDSQIISSENMSFDRSIFCAPHFQKAEKHVARSLKKAGLNGSSTNKLAPKFHVIIAEHVRQIQSNRRIDAKEYKENLEIKEEDISI
ncbi:RNA-directed DNA polymerase, eukaryota [Tanacetum coccineum]